MSMKSDENKNELAYFSCENTFYLKDLCYICPQ